jgi:hypothetical protein
MANTTEEVKYSQAIAYCRMKYIILARYFSTTIYRAWTQRDCQIKTKENVVVSTTVPR